MKNLIFNTNKTSLKGRLNSSGFTVVELLIVIAVIGTLAAISTVGYNGFQDRANTSSVASSASQVAKKLAVHHATHGQYPEQLSDIGITPSGGVIYEYTPSNDDGRRSYCATVSLRKTSYKISNSDSTSPTPGACFNHLSGGTIPRGVNIAPPLSQWIDSTSGGISYNSSTKEVVHVIGQGGNFRSPLIRVEGPRLVTVKAQSYATQASSSHAPNSGIHTSITYYAADGVTLVQNNSGHTSNGNTVSTPLNSWQSYLANYSTNSEIKYIRVTFNSSSYTSDNRVKDVEITVSD